ncbi:MAG: N-acetylneuraminate synthase [Candidatus Marinimicrobia bacterium]|nr:N-acetylneuraminate synthase [Candidatus Neomarinimicrobiota bacterium]|tara:strand:- start:158 stop:1186 length:1029 start_codon:yes stop_codon:yes gene_type:complete
MTALSQPQKPKPCFIIAEAGVNHNGRLDLALELIDAAAMSGSDAVKFQTFKAERVNSIHVQKPEYQLKSTDKEESFLEMARKLELDHSAHLRLIDYCKTKGILFLSAAHDYESIEYLHEFGMNIFKIPSGDLTNLPFLRKVGKLAERVILSTGMSNMKEVRNAVDIIMESGIALENITVLQCNTEYPTPVEDVNLLAMDTIRKELGVSVGYSDHTQGIVIPIAAVAMGATVIEKHFTLDRCMKGPDHSASLEPAELKQMVASIRKIEAAMGDGVKKPSNSELKNINIVRKSIVAKHAISKGELFSKKNLTIKRPGTGVSPLKWDSIIGTRADKDYNEDDLIS